MVTKRKQSSLAHSKIFPSYYSLLGFEWVMMNLCSFDFKGCQLGNGEGKKVK